MGVCVVRGVKGKRKMLKARLGRVFRMVEQ